MVERGFAALALMAQSWENFLREEVEVVQSSGKWESGQAAIAKAFSALLQQAWLPHIRPLVSLSFIHHLTTWLFFFSPRAESVVSYCHDIFIFIKRRVVFFGLKIFIL